MVTKHDARDPTLKFFSAPIQLATIPGHGSQKLFFLFPIPTSLFFIKLIFFNCSRGLPYLANESPKIHTLVARGAEHPTLDQTLSTLSRLLRQTDIYFRPILYDALMCIILTEDIFQDVVFRKPCASPGRHKE
jgi:hypothetical protein